MFPNLLVEVLLRPGGTLVTDALLFVGLRVRGPCNLFDRSDITTSFVQYRIAHVDVVTEHMWSPIEAVVDDPVTDGELAAANFCFNAALEMQILAKNRRLLHNAFTVKDALIAFPVF